MGTPHPGEHDLLLAVVVQLPSGKEGHSVLRKGNRGCHPLLLLLTIHVHTDGIRTRESKAFQITMPGCPYFPLVRVLGSHPLAAWVRVLLEVHPQPRLRLQGFCAKPSRFICHPNRRTRDGDRTRTSLRWLYPVGARAANYTTRAGVHTGMCAHPGMDSSMD